MSDIYLNSAIDRFITDTIDQMMFAYPDELMAEIRDFGPKCTDDEIEASLKRLLESKTIQFYEGYYAQGSLSKADMRRFCG